MNIGKRIKILRKERGFTQQQLADAIGKSKSTIEKYEAGKVENIPYFVIDDISESLQIPKRLLMVPEHILLSLNPDPFKNFLNISNDELGKMMREDYFKPNYTEEDLIKSAKESLKLEEMKVVKNDNLSTEERDLLNNFNKLNDLGKMNVINYARDLTELSKYTNQKCNFEVDTIAAHNDHLDEEGEMENIIKDLEDMDKWQ